MSCSKTTMMQSDDTGRLAAFSIEFMRSIRTTRRCEFFPVRQRTYARMMNSNSDDRRLKAEVAVFLDWSMTSDGRICPSSSAREQVREREREKANELANLLVESRKQAGSNFQCAHKNLIARELSRTRLLSLAFSPSVVRFILHTHTYIHSSI